MDERLRLLGLTEGQRQIRALFAEVTARHVVAPGACESGVGDRVGDLARAVLGSAAWRARAHEDRHVDADVVDVGDGEQADHLPNDAQVHG
ncbi:hypothetical protein [Streptomyces sp. NPDC056387]|uniref:hypothetical protein n=1 Tax=Streptomyces sp. NPDC056387 TaxID=3345803 RepID=UPI0035DE868B